MLDNWGKGKLIILALFIIGIGVSAFLPPSEAYVYPMDNYTALAGTFGELRSNHFHSGIDIKTYRKIGIPVKAASSGYVYRLKASPFGFGRAVYLKHDDGNFSVYAHLDRFSNAYEALVFDRQKKEEKYEQEIYLPRDQIRVKKGEIIGYSGNSGSSYGPHLHFEIRDKDEKIINPLQFYPEKIADHINPIVQELAFEPLEIDSRVEGKWEKLRLTPQNLGGGKYRIRDLIRVKGKIGIEYMAFDRLDKAPNHCGINYARLYLDGKLIHDFRLDTFAFEESRNINMHIDYEHYAASRRKLQRAYVIPGNSFSGYDTPVAGGIISLKDNEKHSFRLELKDFAGNTSTVEGNLMLDDQIPAFPSQPTYYNNPAFSSEENHQILKIAVDRPSANMKEGLLYKNVFGELKTLAPSYHLGQEMVFLMTLDRYDYPLEIKNPEGAKGLEFYYYEELFPDQNNLVELDELQVFFPHRSIFTRLHLQVRKLSKESGMYSHVFEVGDEGVPLRNPYLISFKVPKKLDRRKMVVARWDRNKWEYAGSVAGGDQNVFASLKEFGKFCLMADSTAPVIRALNFKDNGYIPGNASQLVLSIDDDFAGIDHETIRGTIDGKWVPFEYFFRQNKIRYDFNGKRPEKGLHTLKIQVGDNTGNLSELIYRLRF